MKMSLIPNHVSQPGPRSLAFLVLLSLLVATPLSAQEARPDRDKRVNVADYLYQVGEKYGVQFTFEFVNKKHNVHELQQLDPTRVELTEGLSAAALTRQLNESFAKFRFVASDASPKIVHVIDKRLDQVKDYAIEQKATIQFSGTPHQLVRKLHESIPSIGVSQGGSFRQAFDDDFSQITVDRQNQPVRNLLTSGSKWDTYGPRIWIAVTPLDTHKTVVQFYGPKRNN